LKEGVPAVCLIARILNDYSNIIKVVQTCFRQVKNSEKLIGTGGLNPQNTLLTRCLYLLGLFAQHARIDENREQVNPALGLPKNVSVTSLIAKLIAAFTKPVVPEQLRKVAISSYGTSIQKQSDCQVICVLETLTFLNQIQKMRSR
jgi:hypothetical protein